MDLESQVAVMAARLATHEDQLTRLEYMGDELGGIQGIKKNQFEHTIIMQTIFGDNLLSMNGLKKDVIEYRGQVDIIKEYGFDLKRLISILFVISSIGMFLSLYLVVSHFVR